MANTENPTPDANNGNKNQLVIHDSVLMIATEGTPGVEGPYETRHPFWPGSASGVSLGIGYDIGASGTTMAELTEMLLAIGVPMKMITPLEVSIGKQGQEAKEILKTYQLAQKTQLTQQQSLDIGCLIKINNKAKVRRYFPNSYATMHPGIIEGLTKFSVNAPALIAGYSKQNFAGLGPMFDSEMATFAKPEDQFRCMVKMCDTIKQRFPNTPEYVKTANAIAGFINYIWKQTSEGIQVVIDSSPINVEQLLDPNNKTLDVARIADAAKEGTEGTNYRIDIAKSRAKEPALIKAACDRIGCEMPRLSGTAMTPENIARFHKANTSGRDIELEQIQEELVRKGFYKKAGIAGEMKNVDGKPGKTTQKVVQTFQLEYNQTATDKLPTDGSLDAATKKAILGKTQSFHFEIPNPFVPNPQPNPTPNPNPTPINFDIPNPFITPNPTPTPTDNPTNAIDLINMAMSGKGTIKTSVGRKGTNETYDVIVVKALLHSHGYYKLAYDPASIATEIFNLGVSDSKLETAIAKFQLANGVAKPDGRVDANGKTLGWLNGNKKPNPTPNPNPAPNPTPQIVMPKPMGNTAYTCYN